MTPNEYTRAVCACPHPRDTLTAHVSWIQQEISVPVLFPWEEVTNP